VAWRSRSPIFHSYSLAFIYSFLSHPIPFNRAATTNHAANENRALLEIEWVILGVNVDENRMDIGFLAFPTLLEVDIMFGWKTQRSDSGGSAYAFPGFRPQAGRL
jgi:hypothetical protein